MIICLEKQRNGTQSRWLYVVGSIWSALNRVGRFGEAEIFPLAQSLLVSLLGIQIAMLQQRLVLAHMSCERVFTSVFGHKHNIPYVFVMPGAVFRCLLQFTQLLPLVEEANRFLLHELLRLMPVFRSICPTLPSRRTILFERNSRYYRIRLLSAPCRWLTRWQKLKWIESIRGCITESVFRSFQIGCGTNIAWII